MLIDWFTVLAQIVNFLILVWLLNIFLFKPILAAVTERQSKINAQLQEAKLKQDEAAAERQRFAEKNADFDQQRQQAMSRVDEEAHQLRQKLFSDVKIDAEQQRTQRHTLLERETNEALSEFKERIEQELFSIARKAITDLADQPLQSQIVNVFLRRLRQIPAEDIKCLAAHTPLTVRTSLKISLHDQDLIRNTLNELFDRSLEVSFMDHPDLGAGIELVGDGQKITWNLRDYLTALQARVGTTRSGSG